MRPPAAPRRPAAAPGRAVAPPREPAADPQHEDLLLDAEDAAQFEAFLARTDAVVEPTPEPVPAGQPVVATLADRRTERRRAYWRVLAFRVGIGLGILATLAAAVWLVWFSPVLALRADQITITGGSAYLDPAAVTAMVAADEGVPLARINTGAHAEAITALPAVEDAVVTREWPGGISVEITPREPVAVAAGGDGATADLVGADGVVVAQVPADAVPPGLPYLAIDMTSDDSADTVTAVLSVLGTLTPELSGQIAEVKAGSPTSIAFTLTSGAEVVWGSAQDTALKDRVLLTLLQVGASYYDVSTPLAPITR